MADQSAIGGRLIHEALKLGRHRTKEEAVNAALEDHDGRDYKPERRSTR
jgi:hypothetical protein